MTLDIIHEQVNGCYCNTCYSLGEIVTDEDLKSWEMAGNLLNSKVLKPCM